MRNVPQLGGSKQKDTGRELSWLPFAVMVPLSFSVCSVLSFSHLTGNIQQAQGSASY